MSVGGEGFDDRWAALLRPGDATAFFGETAAPLRPHAGAFCPTSAWWLAELSRLLYRATAQDRAAPLASAGLREIANAEESGTACSLIAADDGSVSALIFRGTADPRNWITNLSADTVRAPGGGRVHRGFLAAFESVRPQVESWAAEAGCPLLAAGHSLGGALAVLAATTLDLGAVYTFGAPRVGDRPFCGSIRAPLYRVVNHRDLVPSIPPAVAPFVYWHAGETRYFAADGRLLAGPSAEEVAVDQAVADRGLRRGADLSRILVDPLPHMADHAAVNYVTLCAREMARSL